MRAKRYETLGCFFNGTPAVIAADVAEKFLGVGNYPSGQNLMLCHDFDTCTAFDAVALHHLGYELTRPLEYFLEGGFDVVVDYFCGDWWKVDDGLCQCLDKTREDRTLVWIDQIVDGLPLGLLSERWDDLAKVCAWVEADLEDNLSGADYEAALVDVYLSIAAGLRPEPMPGLEEVEARIVKCRKQEPKLLFQAWDAARSGDQMVFEKVFLKALKHFEKNFAPENSDLGDYCRPTYWVARHHSVVAMVAQRHGMVLPELTPKQDAWIMTRQSLGLPPKGA